jgi:hypothetical protein
LAREIALEQLVYWYAQGFELADMMRALGRRGNRATERDVLAEIERVWLQMQRWQMLDFACTVELHND